VQLFTSRKPRCWPPRLFGFVPPLEALEHRLAPAVVTWNHASGGDWAVGSYWDAGHAPLDGDDAVIANLSGSAAVTYSSGVVTLNSLTSGAKLVLSGGSLTTTNNLTLTGSLTVQSGATLTISDGAAVVADDLSYSNVAIVVNGNGTLNTTNAHFTHTYNVGTSARLVVNAGAIFTTHGNTFDERISIPADYADDLTDNLGFQDVNISGSLSGGQSATLAPLGANTQLTQRYVFTGTFNVQSGASLTVIPGVGNGATLVADDLNYSNVAIVVNGNGTLNTTNAHFTHTYNVGTSARLVVNAGAIFTTHGNTFDERISIPADYADDLTDNLGFQDVNISGSLSGGQSANLVPLGLYSQSTQRYVFTGTFNVAAGAILNVSDGAAIVADDLNYSGVAIVVNGTMSTTDAHYTHTSTSARPLAWWSTPVPISRPQATLSTSAFPSQPPTPTCSPTTWVFRTSTSAAISEPVGQFIVCSFWQAVGS
jgi:hypothetical protein